MFKVSPLIVLSLSATLMMVGVGMIVALLPQRVYEMTGTLESVGLIAAVFALAYLLAQLPVGILSDWLGAKGILVAGYLLCGLSGLVFFLSETAGGVYLGRAIQGLGEAPVWALGPAVLSLAYPADKGRAIGIYNAAIHIGLMLGPILGLVVTPDGRSSWPFLIFAGLCFAAGLTVLIFLKTVPLTCTPVKRSFGQFCAVFREKRPVVVLVGVLLYGAGYGLFVSVLPISLTDSHGFGSVAISALFILFYAAVSFSQIIAGPLSDRMGRQGFLLWGMALPAFGMAVFPFVPGLFVFIPLGLASIGLGIFCVASISELNDCVSDDFKGAISGGYYFFWGAGYVLGPLVVGALAARSPVMGYAPLALLFALQCMALRFARE